MKKVLLVAVLVGVVYFIGGSVSDAINGQNNQAQTFAAGTTNTQVTQVGAVKLATKNGKVLLYGNVKIKAANPININFQFPNVFKDGQPYPVASSSFAAYIKRITIPKFNAGVTTNGFTVQAKKGTNTYTVQWVINESSLTPGIYTMNLNGFTIGTSSTTTVPTVYPLATMSDTTIIRPTTPEAKVTALEGLTYRLVTAKNVTMPASSTIDISFAKGTFTLKICNNIQGRYNLSNSRLGFSKVTTTKMACGTVDGVNYGELEQKLFKAMYEAPLVFLTGDTLTMSSQSIGVWTFKKITPGAVTTPTVRHYPCDFVGPLEVGAVRDCGNGLGLGGALIQGAPTITAISPSVGSIGTTVTLTGTNFKTTGNVILMDNLGVAGSGLPVATAASSNGTSLTFTVPTSTICPAAGNVMVSCIQQNLTTGTYNVSVYTSVGTSNTITLQLN